MDVSVVPAIIPADFEDIREHVAQVRTLVERVQVDVIDGHYAPTITWPFSGDEGEWVRLQDEEEGLPYWQDVEYEIDLMVLKPEQYVRDWIQVGVSALIVHVASTEKLPAIREMCTESYIELGVAFSPSDDLNFEFIGMADFVQLMGNDKLGYHGVELDEKVLESARKIRAKFPGKAIGVDIGVGEETAPKLKEAGVNKLVSGSYIFDSMEVKNAIEKLRG